MKRISSILVAVLLLQIGYVPCAAQEAVVLKGDEIDSTKLKVGMYVEVTYYSPRRRMPKTRRYGKVKLTARGYIKAVEDDALTIVREGAPRKRIKYRDIISIAVGYTEQDLIRLKAIQTMAPGAVVPGARVRITAPSVSAEQFIGEVVRVSGDTLVVTAKMFRSMVKGAPTYISKRLEVPFASVTRLDVSRGKKNHILTGALVGLLVGGGVGAIHGSSLGDDDPEPFSIITLTAEQKAAAWGIGFGAVGLVIGAAIGATKKTDIWKPVPLDRIRVSMAPQRHGGLALSASFEF